MNQDQANALAINLAMEQMEDDAAREPGRWSLSDLWEDGGVHLCCDGEETATAFVPVQAHNSDAWAVLHLDEDGTPCTMWVAPNLSFPAIA